MALDKLVDSAQLDADLESVADAIREKGGTSEALSFPNEFITAIEAIQSGGNLIAKTVTQKDVAQIITKDTEIRTTTITSGVDSRTSGSIIYNASAIVPEEALTNNTEYAVTGRINVVDSSSNILEYYDINTTFIWSIDGNIIVENDENAYYEKFYFQKSGNTQCRLKAHYQKTAKYGYVAYLSICEITNYDGLSSVTINAQKYPETLIKNWISRAADFTNIEWPDGLTSIGSYAFTNCGHFNPPSLPSGITSIGSYAFYSCSRLKLTSLPSGITSIGEYAFYSCSELLLTSLPNSITSIEAYTFYNCKKITLSSLPSNVKKIYSYAFFECQNIEVSSLPSGLTILGAAAFSGCEKITVSSIPNTITNKTVSTYCFKGCIGITTMNIQSGITKIDTYAFQSCHNLANLTLPDTITSIGQNAFVNCRSLISVECNGAITTLASGAFSANASGITMQLQSVSFPQMALASQISTVFGNTTAGYACKSLEFVDIGKTTGIAANAFANCYSLETLVLRKTASVCTLGNVSAFLNTPLRGYDSKTGTVYVPNNLIANYKTATNWSTLYNAGTVTFKAIEGSDYELD